MSETLLERIKRIDEQDHALGMVTCYAGDVLETINDAVAAERARLIEEAFEWTRTHKTVQIYLSGSRFEAAEVEPDILTKTFAAALKAHLESLEAK